MDKYLIDTNICLDAALLRGGNEAALKILSGSESGKFQGIVAGHAMDTIFYIIEQQVNKKAAYKVLQALSKTVNIGTIKQSIFDDALQAQWNDFEDALHHFCAVYHSCSGIITHNIKDFKNSNLPVISPEDFVITFLS